METVSTRIPTQVAHVRGGAQLSEVLRSLALPGLGERSCGTVITDHRSSWVRLVESSTTIYFVKTYDYSTAFRRWSGVLRNTGPWTRSRAAREYDAMRWMMASGLPSATPMGVLEWRTFSLLRRAVLITAQFEGSALSELLPEVGRAERLALALATGHLIGHLHCRGFRDRNLDLRNLLAQRRPDGGWHIVKIDSPRHVLRRPGIYEDALTRADWARLLPQLTPFDLADVVRQAAADVTA